MAATNLYKKPKALTTTNNTITQNANPMKAKATPFNANANTNGFDLGMAFDNNNKMKYRQQGIDALKPVEPYKLDLASIQSDPTYQAAMESARQATQVAEGNISSALNRRGIMDSSITANAASNAAQQEYGRVNRELLPQLIEDQYKRYIDQNNLNRQYASDLFGVSDMYANDDQTAFSNSVTEAGLTGNYLSPEARALSDRLITLKNSTEAMWSTLSPEQRESARAQGDQIRARLDALGVNSSLFGSDVTANNAQRNVGQSGIRTLGGVASDQQGRNANWGAYMDVVGQTQNLGQGPQSNWGNLINQAGTGQNTFGANQQAWENNFAQEGREIDQENFMLEFQNMVQQQGIDNALNWAQQNLSAQRESRISSGGGSGGSSKSGSSNSSSGGYYEASAADMNEMFDTLVNQFSAYNDTTGETTMTKDPAQLRSLVESILDFELPDDQTANMLRRFGISQKRAEELLKSGAGGGNGSVKLPSPEQIMRDTLGL